MPATLFSRLIGDTGSTPAAERLYAAAVAQARRPELYAIWCVPDSVDGRFDSIVLHVFLVLHRLKKEGSVGAGLAQEVFDTMFADMDRSLREMGVGDLSVGRRVRQMAEGFYGRAGAYEAGLAGDDPTLSAALLRNLYGTAPGAVGAEQLAGMCRYIRGCAATLAGQGLDEINEGHPRFAVLPMIPSDTK